MKLSLNHVYRSIWSEALNTWVAVSELTSAKGKRSGSSALNAALTHSAINISNSTKRKSGIKFVAVAVACCFTLNTAQANPVGAQVVNGAAAISQNGNTLTVTNSPNAIINWQSFSINAGETTRFVQQSASSSVLNRVLGADPSQLLGTLTSNGKVFLINPAGILVGQGARIDVAGLVASTLNLSNEDFLAGKLSFGLTPGAGSVQNFGAINTPEGGTVYLVAPQVDNQGIITTPKGETILAAGNTVQLLDTGTPGVTVQVTGADNAATNVGQILADSGRIGMVGAVVKNSGTLSANSLVSQGGRVFLKASKDIHVEQNANVEATGAQGGRIEVLGNRVAVTDNARLDASGQNGGGTVLVGGDYQGKNPDVQNATITYFGHDASIKADALSNGNGGKVILWADDTTRAYGSISVQGGAGGGNGGFVETSGHRYLDVMRAPNLAAQQGRGGAWLLDPENITISSSGSSNNTGGTPFRPASIGSSILQDTVLRAALLSGGMVTVDTTGGGAGAGNILVHNTANLANINVGPSASLNLKAHNDITVDSLITATGNPLAINLIADQDMNGFGAININAMLNSNGGNVELAGNAMNLVSPINAGPVWLRAGTPAQHIDFGGPDIAGTVGLSNTELSLINAPILRIGSMTGTGNLYVTAPISLGSISTLSLEAGGNIAQCPTCAISISSLAVKALDNVMLDAPGNMVNNLAAQVGDGAHQNKNFSFKSNAALNIGAGIDGLSGISINVIGLFSPGTPDGVIALTSGSALTQSAGALLAGKAVYAEGSRVMLANANPTGVIAGRATGSTTGDSFNYTSSSGIFATTVNGFGGIQAANPPEPISIVLTAGPAGIAQDASGIITTGRGLFLDTSGPVGLFYGNNVAALATGPATGQIDFNNSGPLALGIGGVGIASTNQNINIKSGGLMTVKDAVSAGAPGSVALEAPGIQIGAATGTTITGDFIKLRASGTISTAGSVSTLNSGTGIALEADNINLSVAPVLNAGNEVAFKTATDNRSITIGTSCNAADPSCLLISGATISATGAPDIVIGNDVIGDLNTTGNIHVDAPVTHAAGRVALLSGGSVSQASGAVITAQGLGVLAGGAVTLNESNAVTNFVGQNASGAFSFTNTQSLNVVSMTGGAGIHARNITGITAAGALTVRTTGAGSDIVLNNAVSSSSAGDAIVLAAGRNFINIAGAGAISAPSGRWLVYSTNPALDTRGGLVYNFKQYNLVYANAPYAGPGSGDGFIYSIAPAITPSLVSPVSKVYDTTNTATLLSGNYSFAGSVDGDTINFGSAASTTYSDKNAGSGKNIAATGISITANNGAAPVYGYTLSSTTANANIGDITPAALTITAAGVNRVYDATTAATATLSDNRLGSDILITGYGSATFADKNVGSGKTVSVGGITLGGTDAGNYTFNTGASTTANITPAALTITAAGVNRVYDATTAATAILSDDRLGSDILTTIYGSATFADKNVGGGKTVTVGGITLGGTDAGNYTFNTGAITTANITPAPLAITANDFIMSYDGSAYSGGNGVIYAGLVGGETPAVLGGTLAYSGTSQGAVNEGSYLITPGGLTSGNYTIGFVDGALTIAPPITADITAVVETVAMETTTTTTSAAAETTGEPAVSDAANVAISADTGSTSGSAPAALDSTGEGIGGTADSFGGGDVSTAAAPEASIDGTEATATAPQEPAEGSAAGNEEVAGEDGKAKEDDADKQDGTAGKDEGNAKDDISSKGKKSVKPEKC